MYNKEKQVISVRLHKHSKYAESIAKANRMHANHAEVIDWKEIKRAERLAKRAERAS